MFFMIMFFGVRKVANLGELKAEVFRFTSWEWLPLKGLLQEASERTEGGCEWLEFPNPDMISPPLLCKNGRRECEELAYALKAVLEQTDCQTYHFDTNLESNYLEALSYLRQLLAPELGVIDPETIEVTSPLSYSIDRDRVLTFVDFLLMVDCFWIA